MTKYGVSEFTANVKKKRNSLQSLSSLSPRRTRRMSAMSTKSQNEIRQTFIQAMLYISGMILTFVFPALIVFASTDDNIWLIWKLQNFFLPLLGFFNFFIFIRPRVVITMEAKPDLSFFRVLITAITAKEIKPQQAKKRASVGMTVRRRSLLGSPESLDEQAINDLNRGIEIESDDDLDINEIESDDDLDINEDHTIPNNNIEPNNMSNNPSPYDTELEEVVCSDGDTEDPNMTEDYTNML